jgi:hypothetical protein
LFHVVLQALYYITVQAMESSAAERRRRENAEIAERLRREEEDKAERLRREEEEKMTNTCHHKEYATQHPHVTSSIPTHVRYDGVHVSDKDMFRQRVVALWLSDITGKVRRLHTSYYPAVYLNRFSV